jgi:hypothetical protein
LGAACLPYIKYVQCRRQFGIAPVHDGVWASRIFVASPFLYRHSVLKRNGSGAKSCHDATLPETVYVQDCNKHALEAALGYSPDGVKQPSMQTQGAKYSKVSKIAVVNVVEEVVSVRSKGFFYTRARCAAPSAAEASGSPGNRLISRFGIRRRRPRRASAPSRGFAGCHACIYCDEI